MGPEDGKVSIQKVMKGDAFASMVLERSLSGVDDTVSPRTLCDISQEFAFVEPLGAVWRLIYACIEPILAP